MNSHLRQTIVNSLKNLVTNHQTESPENVVGCKNPTNLLKHTETKVAGLREIWDNVEDGMLKARKLSLKDAKAAEAAYLEAEFKLQQVLEHKADQGDDDRIKKKTNFDVVLETILDLVNEASRY